MTQTAKCTDWAKDAADISFIGNGVLSSVGQKTTSSVIKPEELDAIMSSVVKNTSEAKGKGKSHKKNVFDNQQFETKDKSVSYKNNSTSWTPCHKTHPMLPIIVDGKSYGIYGGSCHTPAITDMDVFVGLDSGMSRTSRQFPWCAGEEFLFHIADMQVPKDIEQFKHLIEYLAKQILEGKKVFVGCIGGHGRTGLVFSALVNHMTGMEDSTTYVRQNYCKKVVESVTQVDWLNNHFGIKKVEATKGGYAQNTSYAHKSYPLWDEPTTGTGLSKKKETKTSGGVIHKYGFVKLEGNIHGTNV